MASIAKQQIALAKTPNPVILSDTSRPWSDVESKDPEVVSLAMEL
jgi:hypothetical protein